MRIVVLLLLLAVVTFRPGPAVAFGYDGHRIVCAIAWDMLTPDVRKKVAFLLERESSADTEVRDTFIEGCLWADEVRPWRKETTPYHYINVPRGASSFNPARDCLPDVGCVADEVLIEANLMRRTYARDALLFLAHFTGDMHQPLHAGYADDLGGNLVKGRFMGRETNLHGLWDYGLLEATGRPWRDFATELSAGITQADRWTWIAGTPRQWMSDTLALAQSPTVGYGAPYTPTVPFDLGADYLAANLPTIYSHMQKAGVRLAELLTNFLQ